ncbi:MAG TPA: hypothetical protein VMY69_01095, partial [Phycisphaerae bacterium]|nr:hypothetical protein [Phycisphaerae bacterium]
PASEPAGAPPPTAHTDRTAEPSPLLSGSIPARSIQITDGTVHIENRRTDRSLTLTGVHASLGQLAATGQGYVNLTADLPAGPAGRGRIIVTANLSTLALGPWDKMAGSVKAEWNDVGWADAVAAVGGDARLAGLIGRTSGRVASAFGQGAWTLEGAIEANDVRLGLQAEAEADLAIPQAVLGFQMRRAAGDQPIRMDLVKFSAPGVDLHGSGVFQPVRPSKAAGPPRGEAAGLPAVAGPNNAAPASGGGADAPAKEPAAPLVWGKFLTSADLEARGTVSWAPLRQNLAILKRLTEPFETLGGGADLTLRLVTTPEGLHVTGSVNLTDSQAVWRGVLRKESGQTLRLEVDGTCAGDLATADIQRLEWVTDAGRANLKGRVPLRAAWDLGQWPPDTQFEWRADLGQVETLTAMAPAVAEWLGPVEMSGALGAALVCTPAPSTGPTDEAADGGATWNARLQANLTAARMVWGGGREKPAGTPATLNLAATLSPKGRSLDVRSAAIQLATTKLEWNGSAQVTWPEQAGATPPAAGAAGKFSGTLAASDVEAAGAILDPTHFASGTAPLGGDAVLNVLAEVGEGRLNGRLTVDASAMTVRIPGPAVVVPKTDGGADAPSEEPVADYFLKPAGQPASIALTGWWAPGAEHHLEGEALVTLPGVRLTAFGHLQVAVRYAEAASQSLRVNLLSPSTVEVRTVVDDLNGAMDLMPALKAGLADGLPDRQAGRIAGGAESRLVFSLGPDVLTVGGKVDLTDASLDLGRLLQKPRAMALSFDLAADILPPKHKTTEVVLANLESRLGDSVTSLKGRVKLLAPEPAWPAGRSAAAMRDRATLVSLVEEADLEGRAEWVHNAALREALPWFEPLYSRCGLEGATVVTATFAGTPIHGTIRMDADATTCRILNAEKIVKPAGTPATLHLEARYGEVPGELILEQLVLKLADAEARSAGRFLFDDPRLATLSPPTTWSLRLEGRAPDAAALASLFPSRLADLQPSGGLEFRIQASADSHGTDLEACDLVFKKTHLVWLGKSVLVDGPVSYDGRRLATEGLALEAGASDLVLVAYITDPDRAPTGSVILRSRALALDEFQEMIRRTREQVASWSGPGAAEPVALSQEAARWLHRLLTRAQLSCEIDAARVTLSVPQWQTAYDLSALKGEARLAGGRFVVPRFQCLLNEGTVNGEAVLDFRPDPPVLSLTYDVRDLKMAENLRPFIDTTFPGMRIFGTLSMRANFVERLAEGAHPVGRGEIVATDGLLEGPAAPDYIQSVLPGLKLTQYRFNRMSNLFENKENGDTDNRMIFNGRSYDIYIFGDTHPDGRVEYTLGVDLSVSLGSKVISRTLDQGKLPLLYYTGRIVGARFAERNVRYVLPHEFAYDVFVRRNLLLQVIHRIGEKPPEIRRPLVVPPGKDPRPPEG